MRVEAGVRGARVPVCVLNDTRVDRHHGCERVMDAIARLVDAAGFEVIASSPAHAQWQSDEIFTAALARSRLVIVNGEGTLHHDRPEAKRLLEVGSHARALGIPAVLLNAGWEANGPELSALARQFALVAARDAQSAHELRAAGCECVVVPDLSLYSPVEPMGARSGPLAVTDSVDRFKALDLEAIRRATGGESLSIVYPLAGSTGYIRFLRDGIGASDVRSPLRLARLLALRHRLWRASSRSTARFLERLGEARFLVSGRFHACTLALLTGTPFVAVPSNTGKIAGLVVDAGLDRWRAEAALSVQSVREAVAAGWSEAERRSIAAYLAHARSEADALFRSIRALA